MTARDRIKTTISYRRPDHLPANDALWDETIARWRCQGMPGSLSPADYFGFDICSMSLDTSMRFEQKLLAKEGPYIIYEDRYGYTVKNLANRSGTMAFLSHATSGHETWRKHRHRLTLSADPDEPARIDDRSYFAHFASYPSWQEAQEKYRRLYTRGRYMLFDAYGPWEGTWRHRGYEAQLMDVSADPEWLKEMAEAQQDLSIAVLRHCLDLGMKPDGYFMVEDIAYNKGLLMSPASWRKIFKPAVARLGSFLQEHHIDFWLHCCGNAERIFEDLIECGVRVLQPLQTSAGLDVRKLWPRYQGRLVFYGNISVRNMSGSQEALEEEIRSKIALAREGGYIFHSDHSVPPDVTFERYEWLLALARRTFEGRPYSSSAGRR